MKANEAPKKLYFGEVDKGVLDIYSNKESNDEIEYTRTDAFIEKACEWLKEHVNDYTVMSVYDEVTEIKPKVVSDFRKAMKI